MMMSKKYIGELGQESHPLHSQQKTSSAFKVLFQTVGPELLLVLMTCDEYPYSPNFAQQTGGCRTFQEKTMSVPPHS
jgi:hypothetical protein